MTTTQTNKERTRGTGDDTQTIRTKQGGMATGGRTGGAHGRQQQREPCAQTQNKQGNMEQRQDRQDCQGRSLAYTLPSKSLETP